MPESAPAPPPRRPEPGLCSPLLSVLPHPSPIFGFSHPDHLAHPVPVIWFWFRLLLRFRLQGRPSAARGPRRPSGAHPLIPPLPLRRLTGPGLWLRTPAPWQEGGGKDREGCGLTESGGRLRATPALGQGDSLRSRPGFPNAFARRGPRTRRRSAGVRGGERELCARVTAPGPPGAMCGAESRSG